MNVDDGFEAQLRGTQKRRILMAVAGGVGLLVVLCVGLLVSALTGTSVGAAPAANPDHSAMLKASIRAQRSALSTRAAAPAPVAKASPAEKPAPAPVAKASPAPAKARKSSSGKQHAAAAQESDLKRPSIADPVSPPPAKTVASATSTGGRRGDEPADPE